MKSHEFLQAAANMIGALAGETTADTTTFIELTCVNGTLGGVFVKL